MKMAHKSTEISSHGSRYSFSGCCAPLSALNPSARYAAMTMATNGKLKM